MADCSLQKSFTVCALPVPRGIHIHTAAKGLGLVIFPEGEQGPSPIRPFKVKPVLPNQILHYSSDILYCHTNAFSSGGILTRAPSTPPKLGYKQMAVPKTLPTYF